MRVETSHGPALVHRHEAEAPRGLLLLGHGATAWAHISACNPGLMQRPTADNESANGMLRIAISERGYTALAGDGHDDSGKWPAEPSWFGIGMEAPEARLLAREFGQRPDVRYGLTTMCVGLGMGGSIIWENPGFAGPADLALAADIVDQEADADAEGAAA